MTSAQNGWPTSAAGYEVTQAVGEGYYGIVWKGRVRTGAHKDEAVAIKRIDLETCDDTKLDEIRKKFLLLSSLHHPNIMRYLTAFVEAVDVWIVFEYFDCGSVDRLIERYHSSGVRDEPLIATIMRETLQGLVYLHANEQIHRNIKGANILLGEDGRIVFSDFGDATKARLGKKRSTFFGSPCYMAPEVLEQNGIGYDYKADIWSLGITALEIAFGKPPYSDCTAMKAMIKTLNDEPPRLSKKDGWDDGFIEFVESCLQKDVNQRKSAVELLKLKFFHKARGKEYIREKLLRGKEPLEKRIPSDLLSRGARILATPRKPTVMLNVVWDFCENTDREEEKTRQAPTNGREEIYIPVLVGRRAVLAGVRTQLVITEVAAQSPHERKAAQTPKLQLTTKLWGNRGDLTPVADDHFANLPEEETL
eukprot:TRINITY_DN326_c0_g1_i1.p1 TRINITY_DN326_c0_g1~~TRINITY_DN326_c0_g1_i1.p1  ORF type:complete len:421 (+),score=88.21 TRINITY_DN326_c0_g1_i1:186-1448(+)